jgi:hypothetical protein
MRETMRGGTRGCGGRIGLALAVLFCVALPSPSPGQAVETPAPASDEEGMEAMQRRIVGVVGALIDYTRDVRLTEPGLEAVLEHHGAIGEIHDGDASRLVERAFVDGRYDFDAIVRDPAYVSWSQDRGLEPEGFFRELLRLQALRMREESLIGLEEAREEMPEQRAALGQMRDQMGEEQYTRALSALESAAVMVEETRALMEGLPVPTPEEAALLRKHDERIRATLGEDAE